MPSKSVLSGDLGSFGLADVFTLLGMGKKTGHFQFAWRKKSPADYLIAKRITLMARVIIRCLFGIFAKSCRI